MLDRCTTYSLQPQSHTPPRERVRRAVWGMLYADNAGVASRSPDGLARMMTAMVEVFAGTGETAEERGATAATTTTSAATGHRSSGAEVRTDR